MIFFFAMATWPSVDSSHFATTLCPLSFLVLTERSIVAVNLAAMADGQKVDNVPFHVGRIGDPEVAHAQAKSVMPFQAMVGKGFEPKPHVINLGRDAGLDVGWEFEKCGVETGVVNLQRRTDGRLRAGACGGEVPWPFRVRIAEWSIRTRA